MTACPSHGDCEIASITYIDPEDPASVALAEADDARCIVCQNMCSQQGWFSIPLPEGVRNVWFVCRDCDPDYWSKATR